MISSAVPLQFAKRFRVNGPRVLLGASAIAAVLLICTWQAANWARKATLHELRDEATVVLQLQASTLQSELERRRSVPLVLARDADLARLLARPSDARLIQFVDEKLETINDEVGAAVIYLMDLSGVTLASSNWRSTTSFVGHNFSFRPYFQKALLDGKGETFALGSVSQRPGFYVAHAIATPEGSRGVVVMKIHFDDLMAQWRRGKTRIFATDENGVVLLADMPDWQLRTLDKLSADAAVSIRNSMQFGASELAPLPLRDLEAVDGVSLVQAAVPDDQDSDEKSYLKVEMPVSESHWKIHTLTPIEPRTTKQMTAWALIAALSVLAIVAAIMTWWYRRAQIRLRALEQGRAMEQLESLVRNRTTELVESNDRLRKEIEGRERVEAVLRQAQGTLVHAEKLAALGQMAAGISHEVNQPLAAIRSYVDNAVVFFERGRLADVRGNLSAIATLTERIGKIMQYLRDFARKTSGKAQLVAINSAIEGSLALMAHRFRREKIKVATQLPRERLFVWGEQVRIEQVLVNLFQNAADAMRGVPSPRLMIAAKVEGGVVSLTVSDNGRGIDADLLPVLFSAFSTTKEGGGLGLGLYISRGIIEDFGGTLTAMANPGGGAIFEIKLPTTAKHGHDSTNRTQHAAIDDPAVTPSRQSPATLQ